MLAAVQVGGMGEGAGTDAADVVDERELQNVERVLLFVLW